MDVVPVKRITDRERMDRAIEHADALAHDLLVLGYTPQAGLIREVREAIYKAKLDRAIRDLTQI